MCNYTYTEVMTPIYHIKTYNTDSVAKFQVLSPILLPRPLHHHMVSSERETSLLKCCSSPPCLLTLTLVSTRVN